MINKLIYLNILEITFELLHAQLLKLRIYTIIFFLGEKHHF